MEPLTSYKAKVLDIQQRTKDLTSAQDLFSDKDFVALYEHPIDNSSNALAFLEVPENSDIQKMIVIYSVQKLPLDQYTKFEEKLVEIAWSKKISTNLLNQALFPGLDWSEKIQRNFEQPNVKAALTNILSCPDVNSSNKEYVKEILSGEAARSIQELEEAGALPHRRLN